jgi:DNA-binding transcriptional LysR family regulator
MDRLDAMATLIAVVDTGSFSAAARRLATPLPTISRRIAELESHLGAQLLTRSTRRLALTEIGLNYVTACRRVLEDIDEAERLASGEYSAPRGHLVIASPVGFGKLHLAPLIVDFLEAYPEVDVELRLVDVPVDLIELHIDASLRIGQLENSSHLQMRLGAIRHVVCASPGYLERHGVPDHPSDLSRHSCITLTPLHAPTAWTFNTPSGDERFPISSRMSVGNAEVAVAAAVAGLGLTRVLYYQAHKEIAEGRLKVVLDAFEPPILPVQFIYVRNRLMPLKLRAFLDFVGPPLRARVAAMTPDAIAAG